MLTGKENGQGFTNGVGLCGSMSSRLPAALTDERLESPFGEADRPPVLDPRRVALIPVKGVGGAPELVGGFFDSQEPVPTGPRSSKGEEEGDYLGKERHAVFRRQQPGACRVAG